MVISLDHPYHSFFTMDAERGIKITNEIVLLVVGLGPEQWGDIRLVLSFMGSVLVIYVLVHLFSWLIEWREARDLTDSLKRFQESKG